VVQHPSVQFDERGAGVAEVVPLRDFRRVMNVPQLANVVRGRGPTYPFASQIEPSSSVQDGNTLYRLEKNNL
jgi:hypothetical protein